MIRPAIEAWAADKAKLECARALCAAGVAAGPSNAPDDVIADPHVRSHDMLIEVPRPDGGADLLVVGNPIKMSKMSEGPVKRWPTLGEHTNEVLRDELHLTDRELADLRQRSVI